ncbi:helix-turn-helix transcriptional regulator [Pantoea sp. 18069]|uniref:helix-turn-helix domain-containing protein n=1 Tax=Pantoea sp. 18069 TaxID=2681415 RepID=UPI00135A5BC3|nr:helix-turn-helix transcriptional regulator [Pantoea sp. 18069]
MINFDDADVLDTSSKAVRISSGTESALVQLGYRLRVARLRRRDTTETVAHRIGVSRSTYKRMESGSEGVSIGAYFEALNYFGFSSQLFALGDPALDSIGLAYENMSRAKRGKSASARANMRPQS